MAKFIKTHKDVAIAAYTFLISITIVLAVMLFFQYRFFVKSVDELLQVRESYEQHVDMLKRSLDQLLLKGSSDIEEGIDDDSDEDKKEQQVNIEAEGKNTKNDFVVANNEQQFDLISPEEEDRLHKIKRKFISLPSNSSQEFTKNNVKKTSEKLLSQKNSIQKNINQEITFVWPIALSRFWLSSLFGPRRLSNGTISFHKAIDMASVKGTPVKSAAEGKVQLAQYVKGYGNCIVIYHNQRYKTRYAHLDSIGVEVGQIVKRGELIGAVGDTGFVRKTGKDASHLHFEIYQDGQRVNPLKFLLT